MSTVFKVKHYIFMNTLKMKRYTNILGNLSIEDIRSSPKNKLPLQAEVDEFNRSNTKKTEKKTLEDMENDVRILVDCFNSFVKLNIDTCKLHPLHYISLPGYSSDCFLKLSQVELDTLQDEQMLKDFISAIKGGICGDMGNGYVYSNGQIQSHNRREIAGHDQRSI